MLDYQSPRVLPGRVAQGLPGQSTADCPDTCWLTWSIAAKHAAIAEMKAKGVTLLGTGEPRIGAHGTPVVFLHPRDMGGVLIELMETPRDGH